MPADDHAAAGVREGDVLAGKYRIDKILGVGGMGVVIAAHHVHLDERVAIKFMLPAAMVNQEAVTRFAREARAAVKIKSEHVAKVSDVGTLENGAPYMVMEYLDGRDLADWVQQTGALSVEQAVEFLLQACEAIAEAHALGIVHRDLKPANLFVIRRPDGSLSVKVLDFGISKAGGLGGDMTRTTAMMGSPLYMSPEQMRSTKSADARTDIWALGIILHELLTGEVPFSGETMPELVLKVSADPPPPLRAVRPEAPQGLEQVILRCLEKDRERRFQTVAELAVALAPFAPKRALLYIERISGVLRAAGSPNSGPSPRTSSGSGDVPAAASGTRGNWGRTNAPARRDPTLLATVVALALAGGAATLFLLKNEPSSEEASSSAPAAVAPPPPPVATSVMTAPAVSAPMPFAVSSAAAPSSSEEPPASAPVPKPIAAEPSPAPVAPVRRIVIQKKKALPPQSPPPAAPSPATSPFDDRK